MKPQKQSLDNSNMYSIVAKNGYQPIHPNIRGTGFRTADSQFMERASLTNLAETFLLNSFLKRNDVESELSIASFLTDESVKMVSLSGQEDLSAYETIPLEKSIPLQLGLGECLIRRRSTRDFTGDSIDYKELSTLLRAATGISAVAYTELKNNEKVEFNLRTIPSGGGLYPIDLYVFALNIPGLAYGVYRFQVKEEVLIKMVPDKDLGLLHKAFSGQVNMIEAAHPSVIIFYSASPWRSMRKYGDRGLRFVLQEVGAIAQNLHLSIAALGLGSVDCASFYENEINDFLNLDGVNQTILHTTLIGQTP